ncbi:Phosphoenolpyruvate guanylyltransferase [Baekduia alba]|uniref:2-phospho-L-lactate guanylyltransferase n=1 Tax=Baekduia alba TaxID=2997333 RepID=UPI002340A13F|nr:2-phospho-L-lactate guanylyltransferase [Baekduia alba]WCB93242.1 Phosphoenolpyruvate guanylyltransferase [Baekduia alba]
MAPAPRRRGHHTVAILPVKRFGAAKQRLDNDLSDGTRRALAEAMVTDVLIALRRSKRVDEVLVVSGETMAVALAAGYDAAAVVDDPEDAGHSSAAVRGVDAAIERGATRVLLVPGDCPALDPAEVDALLADADGVETPDVVVVPDRHGTGTNALLLTPPDAIQPAFGPGSRERHERLAREAGATVAAIDVPTLGLDVDTVEDLAALRTALEDVRGGASHTRGLLARFSRVGGGAG